MDTTEQDAIFPAELQDDDALLSSQGQPDSDTETSTSTERYFWWNPPADPDGFIRVSKHGLWATFYGEAGLVEDFLPRYLRHVENIRIAASSASPPPGTRRTADAPRPPPIPVHSSAAKSAPPRVDIDNEREGVEYCKLEAISHLHQMDEILEVIEMLPQRFTPVVSPSLALETAVYSISAMFFPIKLVADISKVFAIISGVYLWGRPLWRWLRKYSLTCARRQIRDLIRAFEEDRVCDKDKKVINSWYLVVYSYSD